jgi:hypothetical protein
MTNDRLPPSDDTATGAPSLVSRVQARLNDLDAGGAPSAKSTWSTAPKLSVPPDPTWSSRSGSSQVDDLNRQLEVLRGQLDRAFDELEQRLDASDTRARLAESRASVAEVRASAAEVRLADAEARAEKAHERIDSLLEMLEASAPAAGSSTAGGHAPARDLRSALDRLRSRLDA